VVLTPQVQEPLNETMCGCNDIHAAPGKMGAHGREGDGGCECAGLTMRGRHLLLFDKVPAVRAARRALAEQLNFPPLLTFTDAKVAPFKPSSSLGAPLPPNVKLVTLTSNYADIHDGQLLLRLSHLYGAGEHPTLSQPATVDLSQVFSKEGLKISAARETTLGASRPLAGRNHVWRTHSRTEAAAREAEEIARGAFESRQPFAYPKVTLRPMEVRTFLATFA